MKRILLLLFLVCVVAAESSKYDCEKTYDECKSATADTKTIGGWIASSYTAVSGRNGCLDLFQACKKLQQK